MYASQSKTLVYREGWISTPPDIFCLFFSSKTERVIRNIDIVGSFFGKANSILRSNLISTFSDHNASIVVEQRQK